MEPLGTLAKLASLRFLNEKPQLSDPGPRLGKSRTVRCKGHDERRTSTDRGNRRRLINAGWRTISWVTRWVCVESFGFGRFRRRSCEAFAVNALMTMIAYAYLL
jgi:hypothetical protein